MRALQIYLDSSDFSNLASPQNNTAEQEAVRDFLVEMQECGRIQLRFSAIHILEAAPTTKQALLPASRRFEIIQQLCGPRALVHPFDLIRQEITAADADREIVRDDALHDDGFWLPSVLEPKHFFMDFKSIFSGEIFFLNRADRRRFLKNGEPTNEALHHFRQHIGAIVSDLKDKLALNQSAANLVDQYYAGNVDYAQALHAVRRSLTNLNDLAASCRERGESTIPFSKELRELGGELRQLIDDSRRRLDLALGPAAAEGVPDKDLTRALSDTFDETVDRNSGRLAKELATALAGKQLAPSNPWGSLPGLSCNAMLIMHIARRSMTLRHPRSATSSDLPDALHACYLPYVDVFRADAFTAGQIKECRFPFTTTVVSNFTMLPEVIKAMLKRQEQDAES
ncbi:hypothetical protein [Burkholderia gladioli]|uniref:hypothetical protein n=1 Tax=Burkholderia gladioli TaxID=28095 RepID=UPI00163FF2E2|nr:hypothetical protein [Burkholderia gladioli]